MNGSDFPYYKLLLPVREKGGHCKVEGVDRLSCIQLSPIIVIQLELYHKFKQFTSLMKSNIDSQRHTAKFQDSQMKKLFNQKYTPQEPPQEIPQPNDYLAKHSV